jgi:hypothetical protein
LHIHRFHIYGFNEPGVGSIGEKVCYLDLEQPSLQYREPETFAIEKLQAYGISFKELENQREKEKPSQCSSSCCDRGAW